MIKEPRRLDISNERAEQLKHKYKYNELYVFDPNFLEEYKDVIVNVFAGDSELQTRLRKNMNGICEFIIGDRVKNGLSRLTCAKDAIHMDTQFADITDTSFKLKPGCEYIETIFVHELLHAAARKGNLTGVVDYLRDENGKVIGRQSVGLNEGMTQYLAEQITGKPVSDDIDSYAFNKHVVSLLADTLGAPIITDSYFGENNLLKQAMNSLANDPEYYDKFNKQLDTINKLDTTIRRIKNGSIKPKDPESLAKMEVVLNAQQEALVENLFSKVVLPQIQKQDIDITTKRQEQLLPLLSKHEQLLKPVAKYVAKHHESKWVQDYVIQKIQKDISEQGMNFSKIVEASKNINESLKISTNKANSFIEVVDNFYNENETALTTDNSTKLTPLLKRELENMVTALDGLEKIATSVNTEEARKSVEGYKNFLKDYFHKIPNLDEEIAKIREERKNPKKEESKPNKSAEDILESVRREGAKAAEDATNKKPKPTEKEDKSEEKNPSLLKKNFIVNNITGSLIDQRNKSIYDKTVNIAASTGEGINLEDETLVKLRDEAVAQYANSLSERDPGNLKQLYGDKWKEVLIDAYTEGFKLGLSMQLQKANKEGFEKRKETVEAIKNGESLKEDARPLTFEELKTVAENFEIKKSADGQFEVLNKETKNPIMSERTKMVALFADEWKECSGYFDDQAKLEAFTEKHEKIYNFFLNEITINKTENGEIDIKKIQEDATRMDEDYQNVVRNLFKYDQNKNILEQIATIDGKEMKINPPTSEKQETPVKPVSQSPNEEKNQMPAKDLYSIIQDTNASLEDVTAHLNIYNGQPIQLKDGSYHHPFNDPLPAAVLNARYYKLTGQDHPRYLEEAPGIIDGLLKNKEKLIENGSYQPEYFDNLEIVRKDLESRHPELIPEERQEKTGLNK